MELRSKGYKQQAFMHYYEVAQIAQKAGRQA